MEGTPKGRLVQLMQELEKIVSISQSFEDRVYSIKIKGHNLTEIIPFQIQKRLVETSMCPKV